MCNEKIPILRETCFGGMLLNLQNLIELIQGKRLTSFEPPVPVLLQCKHPFGSEPLLLLLLC